MEFVSQLLITNTRVEISTACNMLDDGQQSAFITSYKVSSAFYEMLHQNVGSGVFLSNHYAAVLSSLLARRRLSAK